VLYFWAAGNESSAKLLAPDEDEMGNLRLLDAWHRKYPEFDMLLVNPSAKNALGIGATHKDDVITGFSSRGPGYDGRIGPHLVAPGFDMMTIGRNNFYGPGSGTSGSCPLAAGAAALLIDQYRKIHKTEPSSALIKAILFNSARDLGLEGPDYVFGYGMVDAQLAANTISGQEGIAEVKQVRSRFIEDSLKHKEQHFYSFTVPKRKKELRITLTWNDLPGHKLINNLDLWARFGGEKKILPLTLNPQKPLSPAKRKRNKRDTAEHIVIENPQAGPWQIVVQGNKVPKGRQAYALVISTGKGNSPPLRKTTGKFLVQRAFSSKGNVNLPDYIFKVGDPIALHALISVSENAYYPDGYYGTVTGRYELRDETGRLVISLLSSWHNIAPTGPGEYRDVLFSRNEIPETVPLGTYRVKTIITMHNGITKTAPNEYTVTISN
jgi:hypothetical protein